MSIKISNTSLYLKDKNSESLVPVGIFGSGADKSLSAIKEFAEEKVIQSKKEIEDKAKETLKTIPDDYSRLSESISEISENDKTQDNRIELLENGGFQLSEDFLASEIKDWLDEHPEATTTVQDGAITEDKINASLIATRMSVKNICNKNISLKDGCFRYDNCTIEDINTETFVNGSHVFVNCTIGTLFIRGGEYTFENCNFEYIKIVNSCGIFRNCKGNGINLVGECSNSIVEFCELTANEKHGTLVISGNVSDNVRISNNRIINMQSSKLTGIELQCINTHGVSNSIIENNYCTTDTNRTAIDISGHSTDGSFRSFNNVIHNNYVVNGNITIYTAKDIIIDGNFCNSLLVNGEYSDNDYGYLLIKNNVILTNIPIRTQRGNPTQKIIITGNTILGDRGIETYYALPENMNIYFIGNSLIGDAVNYNDYGKTVHLPTEMIYLEPNTKIFLPKCYIVKSEIHTDKVDTGLFFNGGFVENTTTNTRYIIYSKTNIYNGQKYLWTQ